MNRWLPGCMDEWISDDRQSLNRPLLQQSCSRSRFSPLKVLAQQEDDDDDDIKMPPTSSKLTNDLAIRLADPSTPLYPGSVILGHVVRKSHIVAPSATIVVRLHGRAKAKIAIDRGSNSKSYYRSRFSFWREGAVSEVVYQGPVHVAPNSGNVQTWPFALTLPTHSDAEALTRGASDNQRAACYVQTPSAFGGGGAGIPVQPLRGSYYFHHEGFSKKWHGFVEYWIEAEMRIDGKGKTLHATLPVRVQPPPTPTPLPSPSPFPLLSDFKLATGTAPGFARTQRLLPGMDDVELSFKQKAQKFFGSSSVPTWHFSLHVEYPTVVRLRDPTPMPFRVRLVTNRNRTSDIIEDVPQTVFVKSVALLMHSTTSVICPGTLGPHEASESRKVCICRTSWPVNSASGVVVPSGPADDALDLGALLGISVDGSGSGSAAGAGKSIASNSFGSVYPSFRTYCLKLDHMLSWELQFSVAGESWEFKTGQPITVLPPVEEVGGGAQPGLASPPPPLAIEEAPPYDGPSDPAPAYEKRPGGGGGGGGKEDTELSAVGERSMS